jgi:hypothetical protein
MNKNCEHNKRTTDCGECGGGSICEHDKLRFRCSRCKPETAYTQRLIQAKRRKIASTLTLEQYERVVAGNFKRCGESFVPMFVGRINSRLPYLPDNCQPSCDFCNRMKMSHSEAEFEKHLVKIIEHCLELAERAGFVSKASTIGQGEFASSVPEQPPQEPPQKPPSIPITHSWAELPPAARTYFKGRTAS